MTLFEKVKSNVTTLQAAERYGLKVGHGGMCRFLLAHLLNGRYLLQCLIILLQRAGCYLAQLQFTDNWLDVVPDQASIAGICGDRPFRFPIQLHIALHSTNATSFLLVDSVLILWYNHFRKM